jgi:hypothetical protein
VKVALSRAGLESIAHQTGEFLHDGKIKVSSLKLRRWDGRSADGPVTPRIVRANEEAGTVTQTYDWGVVHCSYSAVENRLDMIVTVRNESPRASTPVTAQFFLPATFFC